MRANADAADPLLIADRPDAASLHGVGHLVDDPGVAQVAAARELRDSACRQQMAVAEVLAEQVHIGSGIVDLARRPITERASLDDLGRRCATAIKRASDGISGQAQAAIYLGKWNSGRV
jgi:hypothetical protein